MKILITGAHGQLGKELIRQMQDNYTLFLYDVDTLDITDRHAVEQVVAQDKPDIIINAAAYTNVEKAQEQPQQANVVNAVGAENLARAAKNHQAKLVHISTDYVFDGNAQVPYEEWNTPSPISVYGNSKLWGEKLIEQIGGSYFILRTAWLYGDGNNFVKTMLRLAKDKDEIFVVADQYGTPTYTKDLVKVIEQLMQTDYYGIYHASNEGSCSWYEFAQVIMKMANQNTRIIPITTDQFSVKATRPQYAVMNNALLNMRGLNTMRPWQEALTDYLKNGGV